jgi:hypothetical protein
MVLLKIVSNVGDPFDFDVDTSPTAEGEEEGPARVATTRVLLQEILGTGGGHLKMIFRGKTLVDDQTWDSLKPHQNEKLFATVAAGDVQKSQGALIQRGDATARVVSQQMQEREELKRAEQMEPVVNALANNPAIVDMMLAQSPELKELIRRTPELERELRNPENLKMMMMSQLDPDRRREMNTSMQMQLAQLNTIPGGQAMLENYLGDLMHEHYAPKTAADRVMASEEHAKPVEGSTANNEPLPNPWAQPSNNRGRGATGATASATSRQAAASSPNMGFEHGPPAFPFPPFMSPSAFAPPAATTTPAVQQPVAPAPKKKLTREEAAVQYAPQLQQLQEDFGFEDRQLCLDALIEADGDIESAVDWIATHQP